MIAIISNLFIGPTKYARIEKQIDASSLASSWPIMISLVFHLAILVIVRLNHTTTATTTTTLVVYTCNTSNTCDSISGSSSSSTTVVF